ncbi:uncharacterized protein LOC116115218 [Pistacia vera]|uniref:uncharacterized protein LOC116115218 n=1 Tax=Pistacia vera TaxID=55513 RepID=UPI001262E48A|nr:uncharacterized protein LOC116115218 [Pistacia vera]
MARTNKYTSINFNHVLEKNLSPATSATNSTRQPSSSSSYSSIASSNTCNKALLPSSRSHGRMLVLTKPTPKPVTSLLPSPPSSHQQLQTSPSQIPDPPRTDSGSDPISLRPLGRTGTGSESFTPVLVPEKEKEASSVIVSPKPNKFVPPHLRPGFAGKEERPTPEVVRARESGQKHFGSPGRYVDDGRPKSGGYERTRRGGESDLGLLNRPTSSGNRRSYTEPWYFFFFFWLACVAFGLYYLFVYRFSLMFYC